MSWVYEKGAQGNPQPWWPWSRKHCKAEEESPSRPASWAESETYACEARARAYRASLTAFLVRLNIHWYRLNRKCSCLSVIQTEILKRAADIGVKVLGREACWFPVGPIHSFTLLLTVF